MAKEHSRVMLAAALLAYVVLGSPATATADTVSAELRSLIAQAHHPWARQPDFARYVDVVARLYASRADATLWLTDQGLGPSGKSALAAVMAASDEGLVPADYDAATLAGLARGIPHRSWNAVAIARFDLLLTIGLTRYLDDLHGGRIRPGPFGYGRAPAALDLAAAVSGAARGDSVAALVRALEPPLAQYQNLRRHLAEYRRLADNGPFVPLSAHLPIRPGAGYTGAAALRRRLAALGDLAMDDVGAERGVYDAQLVGGVRRFQARHSLEADGLLGPATLAALNVPYAVRVAQIELAMERLRALPTLGRQRFLVVNIPAFELFAFDSVGGSGAPSLRMKVVTGRALDTRTPLFFSDLRYVEFRPYWTVPRSILVKEILPILRRHPAYLRAHAMEMVGPRQIVVGDVVTPERLRQLAAGQLNVRQRPGEQNALGRAKFVFPNAANVYMHGTPQTELFSRSRRDFSHGCIRLEDPEALAAWVLQDQTAWSRQAIEAAMTGQSTTRALLSRPMPVVVYYTTAVAEPDGSIRFLPDVYGHDRTLSEALKAGRAPV